jgi:hypothetical protein
MLKQAELDWVRRRGRARRERSLFEPESSRAAAVRAGILRDSGTGMGRPAPIQRPIAA